MTILITPNTENKFYNTIIQTIQLDRQYPNNTAALKLQIDRILVTHTSQNHENGRCRPTYNVVVSETCLNEEKTNLQSRPNKMLLIKIEFRKFVKHVCLDHTYVKSKLFIHN